jgi:hypothetical protein
MSNMTSLALVRIDNRGVHKLFQKVITLVEPWTIDSHNSCPDDMCNDNDIAKWTPSDRI